MLRRFAPKAVATAAIGTTAFTASQQRTLTYKPRVRDYKFVMEDVLGMYGHYEKLGVAENANKDLVDSLLEECSKICTQELFNTYTSADDEGGCVLSTDNHVTTPKGFKQGWDQIVAGGWQGISSPEEYGGQGLPPSVGILSREMMATANWSLLMYPGLSHGAAETLKHHGSPDQKENYLTKLISGEWAGTMCLTEPHCGTDLAQCKTRAEPQADGTYKLTGTKIFISSGDHDLTPNILHIVLAKLPDAPSGTKGISLFLVPKHVVKEDGSLTKERNLLCTGLEKKMGIKGSATCQMTFEDSTGYIIGKPHDGMRQMFTFMNTARVGTAIQGVAHAELAFQNALHYARDRMSMRSLSGTKEPDAIADKIIHHPNVRHNVLLGKVVAEAGRAFVIDLARMLDILESPNVSDAEKKKVDGEIGFLTPIAKGALTELGLESANAAVQVYGGHGFIKGNGVEQIVRDARISTLYEGTTGIQALDFIGRKVLMSKTSEAKKFGNKVGSLAKENLFSGGVLGSCSRSLFMYTKQWRLATGRVMVGAARNKDTVGNASQDFLMFSGYLTLGYYWLKMAIVSKKMIDAGKDIDGFYQTKLDMCDYYFARVMPRCDSHLQLMCGDATPTMKSDETKWDLE